LVPKSPSAKTDDEGKEYHYALSSKKGFLILFNKGGGMMDPDPSRYFLKHNIKEAYPTAAAVVARWSS
jgi:hypothetical protein